MRSRPVQETATSPSILIVDDTARNVQILAAVLNKAGYKIAAASDGQKALGMIEAVGPDLVLLDIMMPGMDGFEVCRRLKASPDTTDIPVILLTARTAPEDVTSGFEAGAVDYITKPFNKRELLARVRTHIGLKIARDNRRHAIAQLRELRSQTHALSGLLPICAHCKKIRSDEGYWQQLEIYISDHSDAMFSHGVCPECLAEHYPDYKPQSDGDPLTANREIQGSDPLKDTEAESMERPALLLMVDDNPKNLQVLGNVFKRDGYRIAAATNGRQALAMIGEIPPDLILLDIMMPAPNGFQVCQTLKAASKTAHIPIVMLSAKADSEDIAKGLDLGAVDYVTKPFNPAELLARVDAHLELIRMRDKQNHLIKELEITLAHVKRLANMIPICSHCHKVRLDDRYWETVETYISKSSKARFSHGICPQCLQRYYPTVATRLAGRKQSEQ